LIDDDTFLDSGLRWNGSVQDFGGYLYSVEPKAYLKCGSAGLPRVGADLLSAHPELVEG
jgi:hypothetical protein